MTEAYKIIDHTYDTVVVGAGYELKSNKSWSIATFVASLLVTGLVWLYIFGKAF